jgi:predicted CoA-binding protein
MNLSDYQNSHTIQRALLAGRVAVVGMSGNELRASNFVGFYLKRHGYDVVPVNPRETEIYGLKSYPQLTEVPGGAEVVDVFRDPSAVPDIARQAVEIGARFLWLQFGVISEEGIEIARSGGLEVIVDRCIKIEHARYRGRMHWLGFNSGNVSARRSTPE